MEGIEDVAVDEWSRGLRGLTGDQIKKGLDDWDGEWPPSMIDFKNCCIGKSERLNEYGLNFVPQYYHTAERRQNRLLSSAARDISREEQLQILQDIKKILNK